MSEWSKVLEAFIKKLESIVPKTISIYEFKKELALFDKWLKDKRGLVVILDEEDYSFENLYIIDLIYDVIQNEFGWPEGTSFANSFSRGYIRTKNNLWHINIQNSHCLLPEDMINLRNTRKLLYGEDIIPRIGFPHQEEEIKKINISFTRSEAEEIASENPQFLPIIDPECCFTRHDFTIDHSVVQLLKESFESFKNAKKPEKHVHLYGRNWGSGKTQIMYSLIQLCKELQIPYVYRSEFWKNEDGKYKKIDYNPENDPKEVSKWVVANTVSPHFALFLDEVDIDLKGLKKELEKRFPDEEKLVYVISGAKETSDFVNHEFDIYDLTKEYTFSETQYRELIDKLLDKSDIDKIIMSDEVRSIIVKKTRLWNHSLTRKTPAAVILTTSLSLLESIKLSKRMKQEIVVLPEIAEKWALLSTSPWYQRYGELHDVHAEYLIHDGKDYVNVDKHYKHPLP